MRFITRELYNAIQPDSGVPEDKAERDWNERCDARDAHVASIRARLPEGAKELSEKTFHDGLVVSASQPSSSDVVLEVDASDNPWGPQGRFQIVFRGVERVSDLTSIVGDWWLYEEMDLLPDGAFQFSVLLQRSEFEVVARNVEILSA